MTTRVVSESSASRHKNLEKIEKHHARTCASRQPSRHHFEENREFLQMTTSWTPFFLLNFLR